MKRKSCLWLVAVLGLALVAPVFALTIEPLPIEAQARIGANWAVTFTYADFTESTTNTAQSFTNQFAVTAKSGVSLIGMKLNEAFTVSDTNYTDSLAVICGDADDTDRFLASTELASDGTEVWYKYSPMNSGTITVTPQSAAFGTALTLQRSALADSNGTFAVTNVTLTTASAATNATATFAAASLGNRLYTTANYVRWTFTPNAEWALDEFVAGSVTFYFQIDK